MARLTGDAEVPPVVTETSGGVRILFDEQNTRAEIRLNILNGMRVPRPIFTVPPGARMALSSAFWPGFTNLGGMLTEALSVAGS